jgi:hypothetical protein
MGNLGRYYRGEIIEGAAYKNSLRGIYRRVDAVERA